MNIAIIPARCGSDTITDKNIKPFLGKPLIAYTIEAALASKLFDAVLVSTDSDQYASIAREHGAWVPFMRPEHVASASCPTSKVTVYTLNTLRAMGHRYTHVAVLPPTSPLRTAEDITRSYRLLKEKHAEMIISVCESYYPTPWINELPDDHNLKDFIPTQYRNLPRQKLPTYYRIHGAIFWGDVAHYTAQQDPYKSRAYAYIMPPERSVDIDTMVQFTLAEILYKKHLHKHTYT